MESKRDQEKSAHIGGWSSFNPLDAQSKEVFEAAMKGLKGVHYTPTEVSTQVVAGTHYRFRCDAEVLNPERTKFTATVEIHQPLQGSPTITSIVQTSPMNQTPGGWSPFGPLSAESKAVFDRATAELLGVSYVPLEVSTQVVAGMNYRFKCDATVVAPSAPTWRALIEIQQPLERSPYIVRIDRI